MQIPPDLPRLLAEEGARRLALAHLDEAAAARDRLDSGDIEPLHDYRVALRRLRSGLRSYRRQLRSTITPKTRRILRRLARATRDSRDLDVHLAWLAEQRDRLGEEERPGIDWLVERLQGSRQRARDRMLRQDARLYPRVADRLAAELTEFRTTIRLDASFRRRSTAAVTATCVARAARRLEERLAVAHDYSQAVPLHRARIAAKRLRYVLEPFGASVPHAGEVIDRLKSLQDLLGDVHDSHEFSAALADALGDAMRSTTTSGSPVPGVRVVCAALDRRGREAFETARAAWLGGAAKPFFQQLETVGEAIAGLATRGEEIERKFLLTGLPPLHGAEEAVEIEQGYLPGDDLEERLRRVRSGDGEQLLRTIKDGSGISRIELESAVEPDVFARLWPLTEGRRLRKRRHRMRDGDLQWEIDEFLDRDLVLAEVELPSAPMEVRVPDWLRPHVERDVTDDSTYANAYLACHPPGDGGRPAEHASGPR